MIDERSDLQFMQEQQYWPLWPRLPVKKRGSGKAVVGFLWGTLDAPVKPIIYLTEFIKPVDENTPTLEYKSLEAIVADGWVVD